MEFVSKDVNKEILTIFIKGLEDPIPNVQFAVLKAMVSRFQDKDGQYLAQFPDK